MPIVACSPAITSKTEMPARYGAPLRVAGEAHQAGDGLHDEVVARQLAPFSPLPKPLMDA